MALHALPDGRIPVLLSAHAEELIAADAAAILRYLDRRTEGIAVDSIAATLLRTRRVRRYRALIRAADIGELTSALHAIVAGEDHPLVTRFAQSGAPAGGRVAFVFPGQGSQWPSMGVQAYDRLPEYRAEADRCTAAFAAAGHASPLDYLLAEPGSATNDFTQVQIQGAQFVHGVALAQVWKSCGVLPDITVGHSLGEIGAAYVAGAITLPDAVGVVAARATLLDRLTGPYRVAVLGLDPETARAALAAADGWAELSVVNSASSVAVSGDTATIAALVAELGERGVFAREIEMWFPAHTTKLDPLRSELESLLPAGVFGETPVQFIGSATASVVPAGTDFAHYWYTNLRNTVRFDAAVLAAVDHGARVFVELSAHPALLYATNDVLDDSEQAADVLTVGSGRRDEPITDRLAANIAAAALTDTGYRWTELIGSGSGLLRNFPFAPMRAEHLWAAAEPLPPVAGITVAAERWRPHVPAVASRSRRAAVIDLGEHTTLGAALRAAVAADARCEAAQAADADLLIVVAPTFDESDTAGGLGALVDSGLLGYADTGTDRDIWLVTAGGETVGAADPVPHPAQAALGAIHRSLGMEFPEHRFGHLDLPGGEPGESLIAAALTAVLGPAGELAARHHDSGTAVYLRTTRDEPISAPAWTAESGVLDEVVITGGAGVVGLHLARYLADRGARRIVLVSRTGVDAATLAELNAVTHVIDARCDITDAVGLTRVHADFGSTPATLVVHAAGAATIAGHDVLTGADLAATFAAKIGGLVTFAESWPLAPDVRILLCSSVSGLWGGSGHIAYAAANRVLDTMAARMRTQGRRATAVRWGLWPGSGIIGEDEVTRVARSGLLPMAPERAAQVIMRDWPGDPLVFTADPERLATFLGNELATLATPAVSAAKPHPADPAGAVRAALGQVLKLADTSALDLAAVLLDLGVDSLLAIDLRKKLTAATGHKVPLALILGGATGTELIEHLEKTGQESTIA